jgi:hypothetical protein
MSFTDYLKEAEDPYTHQSNYDNAALKYNKPDDIDEIGAFWVVTKPTEASILIDILFKSSVKGMIAQGKGGLEMDDIIVLTKDYNKAKMIADNLLSKDIVSTV